MRSLDWIATLARSGAHSVRPLPPDSDGRILRGPAYGVNRARRPRTEGLAENASCPGLTLPSTRVDTIVYRRR
jgi:hypothetical protein